MDVVRNFANHVIRHKESIMKDQDKDRRKRSIKLGLFFGSLALFVYLGSMYYMIWQH
jgi:hypothetical protein